MQEKLPHSGDCMSGRRIHVQKHCSDIFPFSFSLFGKAIDKWLNMSLWEDRVGLLPPESLKYYNFLWIKCPKKMSDTFLIMRYENCKFTLLEKNAFYRALTIAKDRRQRSIVRSCIFSSFRYFFTAFFLFLQN